MKKRPRIYLCLAAFLAGGLQTLPIHAQDMTVGLRMDVDQRQVEVGDTLTLTIEFKQVGNANSSIVGGPTIPTPEHFEIQGESTGTQVEIINQESSVVSTTKLTLKATSPGDDTLGPASLTYKDEAQKNREIESNIVNVTVTPKSGFSLFGGKQKDESQTQANPPPNPSGNPDDLRGLKPLLPEAANIFRYILWTVVALLIAGFFLWQFLKPRHPSPAAPVFMGREAQLRDAWKKLGQEDLSAQEFCLGLSKLVRECVQYRYQFPAVNYTTEEILRETAKRKASDDERVAIEKCLRACDRVLHADGNLTGRDSLRTLASALLPKKAAGG